MEQPVVILVSTLIGAIVLWVIQAEIARQVYITIISIKILIVTKYISNSVLKYQLRPLLQYRN